jgi:DNA-binding Xre family transcriptional regulator
VSELDDIKLILMALKKAYRAAGVQHKDIAETLGVSQMTVKRMLSGKGLKLGTLIQLCAIIDMTVYELLDATERAAATEMPSLTRDQLTALSVDFMLGTVFFLIGRGWTVERIADELKLNNSEITFALMKLDRLKVITLFPANRIRVLHRSRHISGETMMESDVFVPKLASLFTPLTPLLTNPTTVWNSGLARLSESSRQHVAQLLREVAEEIFAIGENDLNLPANEVRWYATLFVARQFEMSEFMREEGGV